MKAFSIRRLFLASVGFGLGSKKASPSPGLIRRPLSGSEGLYPEPLHSFYSGSKRQISHLFCVTSSAPQPGLFDFYSSNELPPNSVP